MSNIHHHTILKQVVDITLPDMRSAMEWEGRERDVFTKMIRSQLERCLDELQTGNDLVVIEKLQVDLGSFTMKNFHDEMPSRFFKAMSGLLHEHLRKSNRYTEPYSLREKYDFDGSAETEDQVYTGEHARIKAFHSYLANGYLPWWGSHLGGWDKTWLATLTAEEFAHIRHFLLPANEVPLLRIAYQFSEEFIRLLIEKFGVSTNLQEPIAWLQQVVSIVESSGTKEIWEAIPGWANYSWDPLLSLLKPHMLSRQYWYRWLRFACGHQGVPTLHQLTGGHAILVVLLRTYRATRREAVVFAQNVPAIWQQEVALIHEEIIGTADIANPPASRENDDPVNRSVIPAESSAMQLPPESKEVKGSLPDEEETFYITEAGLVLLHPFLPQLFRNLGWLNEANRFIPQGKTKAVYALYYLATGKVIAPEYQLLLPKLLLGIPWEVPLEPVDTLSELETTICDELLVAVIEHWSALRNTSPDGLREGFLKRNGKLAINQTGWVLIVEAKTEDILLSRLPWSISIVKLPWMQSMLSITWQ